MPNPSTAFPHLSKKECEVMRDQGELRCGTHGGVWIYSAQSCQTGSVLNEVADERAAQYARYGTNENLAYGTGETWLEPLTNLNAFHIEAVLRKDYEHREATTGQPTFMHLLREEMAEAMTETNPEILRAELLQVAAVAISWVEKIDRRKALATAAVQESVFQSGILQARISGA